MPKQPKISAAQFQATLGKRKHKYSAVRVDSADGKFDSKAEYRRWLQLKLQLQAGEITDLIRQPRFQLQPKFKHPVEGNIRMIEYVADFQYFGSGKLIVEDVKGVRTEAFDLKRKIFLYLYPHIELRIVK